eukprot:scaffold127085_cov76-Attheya_sp.AAC.1
MTHSSAVRATDIEANDLASTSLPFDDTREYDNKEEDVFDAEAGWYVGYYRYRYLRGPYICAT